MKLFDSLFKRKNKHNKNDSKSNFERYKVEEESNAKKITKNKIQKLIIELKMPQTIIELFNGTCTDDTVKRLRVNNEFSMPHNIFNITKRQQDNYLVNRYKPILAYWDETIYAYDTSLNGFVKYYLEDFNPINFQLLTWEGVMLSQLLTLWEDKWHDNGKEIYTDEDIICVGKLLGIPNSQKIITSIIENNEKNELSSFNKIN